ncbi:MAG: potassium/proton antiporter [Pseudomonadales bacterium]|jgi:cell volume regulation protein A|nr:potassium/proton antiporter [Pseudomonadales bacterium]
MLLDYNTAFLLALSIGAALVAAGILVSPLSSRLGMPVLLFFLAIGMLAGNDGPGHIVFNNVNLSFAVSNLALAIILLDGGMRTHLSLFRVGLKPALALATAGVMITASIVGVAAAWILHLPLLAGLLLGAIVSSTDAAVVFSLLQGSGLSLNERVRATLEIESGSNDPMAIFLTLMMIHLIQQPDSSVWEGFLMLIWEMSIGAAAGVGGGLLVAFLLRKVELVSAMYPLLVGSIGLVLFGVTNLIEGSGFLAIYLMGVVLASRRNPHWSSILQIHDGLAWLAQIIMFLLLGRLVTPSDLLSTLPQALLISVVLILLARPLATLCSLLPFGFVQRERVFMAWVGLRGAVPVVLAIFPLMAGVEAAPIIFHVTFVVVLVSMILQGSTLAPLARWLKLEVPPKPEPELRVPLQLPAAGEHELLLFPLKGKRWQEAREITDIYLPDPSRVVAFFRDGVLFERRRGLFVHEGDVVAVLAQERHVGDVGRILGWEEPPERLTDRRFFGDFTMNGNARLRDVQLLYGVNLGQLDPEQTLADCFSLASRGHPVVGDRLDLGTILLVAREVQGDHVVKAGLKLSKL